MLSRIFLFLSTVLLTASLFVPIWRIDLDAPQYPEGLNLLIYANKLGGNVDIINGLNHYIGMKTLHAEDFIEFTVLPYCIGFFALFSLIAFLASRPKVLYALFASFAAFGVLAVVDFWRWEYNYGHNLDPNAAIIVPGMAYQPPLIGFKQLLNFGAFSIPDLGGWMFVVSGGLMLFAVLYEAGFFKRFMKKSPAVAIIIPLLMLFSCSSKHTEPINLNSDSCDYCKMTISHINFASELLTQKGRVYKFDDLACMINYAKENALPQGTAYYVCDFLPPHQLIKADSMFYISGEKLESPMGGNIAAFSRPDSAEVYMNRFSAMPKTWASLME